MHDEHPHPLLAQVPLTISPFLSLPTATPLPYSYKQLPSTLPPSLLSSPPSTNNQSQPQDPNNPNSNAQQDPSPAYIHSSTGQTATPDTILSSCLALQSHLQSLETSARKTLQEWEERRKAEDLAEKRRVAPGWLDGDVKILRPENVGGDGDGTGAEGLSGHGEGQGQGQQQLQRRTSVGIKGLVEKRDGAPDPREGEELDRAFGVLDLK